MDKIGIATITLTDKEKAVYNYGNILQNYALQRFLRENGYNAETILYASSIPKSTLENRTKRNRGKGLLQFIDDCIRVVKRNVFRNRIDRLCTQRRRKINCFIERNIKFSPKVYSSYSNLSELDKQYDLFITGSDQVWNPYYEGSNPFYYLAFTDEHKRVTYAPSFGIDYITEEMMDQYRIWLKSIPAITIREKTGVKILREKFGIEAELVCDPVFLLSKKQWEQMAKKPTIIKKYFVVYLLGKKTIDKKRQIRKLSRRFNACPIDMYTRDNPASEFAGIDEFVGFIANAAFVCTDSFHGTAFSILFQKPVVTMDRDTGKNKHKYNMNNRINDLLALVGAGNRTVERILIHPDELGMYTESTNNNLSEFIAASKKILLETLHRRGKENYVD